MTFQSKRREHNPLGLLQKIDTLAQRHLMKQRPWGRHISSPQYHSYTQSKHTSNHCTHPFLSVFTTLFFCSLFCLPSHLFTPSPSHLIRLSTFLLVITFNRIADGFRQPQFEFICQSFSPNTISLTHTHTVIFNSVFLYLPRFLRMTAKIWKYCHSSISSPFCI